VAFSLKDDWPIIAVVLLAIVGLVLLSSGGGASAVSTGGLSSSDMTSLMAGQNANAAAIEEAQIAASTQAASTSETAITGLIADVLNNNAALSMGSLQAQVAEYTAYEGQIGNSFAATQALAASQAQAAASLSAVQANANASKTASMWSGISSIFSNLLKAFTGGASLPTLSTAGKG